MVYFPESVIITSKAGIQFKSFSNEHPEGFIIAKPKYIPVKYVFSDKMQFRNLFHKQVNRLDMWSDKKELKYYLQAVKENYPKYFYKSDVHKNWFFAVPKEEIKQVFDPKEGLKSLVSNEKKDGHIKKVLDFVDLILKSGVSIENFGVTFSTLVGHYDPKYSDINIVVYGKKNSWKVIDYLKRVKDSRLKWKSKEEWESYRRKRNRFNVFSKEEFLEQMSRKKTEGFFEDTLFVLFSVPKENENWIRWGEEIYEPLGICEVEGIVIDNSDSLFRPGRYVIKNSKVLSGEEKKIKEVVFYSRDYVMQVFKNEKIRACGMLERAKNLKTGNEHYRIVVDYPDSYLNDRRDKEYIKKSNG